MPKNEIIEKIEDAASMVDGKALAIKLTAMAAVTAATLVATHFVIKAIENKD